MLQNRKTYAPIVIFSYNRPRHLKTTIEALRNNSESTKSRLIIFQDGPKANHDKRKISECLEIIERIKGFDRVDKVISRKNKGLSESVTRGLDSIFQEFDQAIILEDDIMVGKYFLQFMNEGLNLYANYSNVAAINGFVFPTKTELSDTFFLRGADCWGWATWSRAWEKYNHNGNELFNQLRYHKDKNLFDFNGHGRYLQMLQDSINGKNDSWAIKWYASVFLEEMYSLYPRKSLVTNIGLDGSGTHMADSNNFNFIGLDHRLNLEKIPVQDSAKARLAFTKHYKSMNPSAFAIVLGRIKRIMKEIINA